jgi:hypothetical protein
MFALVIAALVVISGHTSADRVRHASRNVLYTTLLDSGLEIGPDATVKLPPPTMPDGLDGTEQRAVIVALIGNDYTYEDFTRKSAVAPHKLRVRDVLPSDPEAPARGVDAWFIAHDDTFTRWLASASKELQKRKLLTKEDLAGRGIGLADGTRETFVHVKFDVLGKVRLQATVRAAWAKTGESVIMAVAVDPRFQNDPEFPNQWQSIIKGRGTRVLGPARPWVGGSFYMKITKLAEPAGALFVEQHLIFAEPAGWFDGANLLRSKLPLVVQDRVRATRRQWAGGARR